MARALHCDRRIAIVGGGTAGHVYPALAVAAAYRAAVPSAEVVMLGTADGLEARLVPASGHRFRTVRGAPFFRVGTTARLRAAGVLVQGMLDARRILAAERCALVLGFGGYVTGGTILAARSLGLPALIHEANAVAGLANGLLGRVATRILLGFEEAAGGFPRGRTVVTGTPVRASIQTVGEAARPPAADGPRRLLVSGGSLGSGFLNTQVPALARRLAAGGLALEVRHQAGAVALAPIRAAYADAGVPASVERYLDDVAPAYRWADFAIACAGSVTLAELAVAGLPALVVPLSWAARDHQSANARAFAAATGVPWTAERGWSTERIAERLRPLLVDPAALAAAAARVRAAARPGAAAAVVTACEELLGARAAGLRG